jgi:hypothetical protein
VTFSELIPELRDPANELVLAAGRAGLAPRVTSTRRSSTQQARLFRRWQQGLSPLPAAPPGTSAHEFGFAFDMVVTPWEALADVGSTWELWGGIWGGNTDPVHFQYPGFVVPAPENVVQRAARTVSDLPWYLSIFLPTSTLTKEVTPAEEARLASRACQLFGLGC